MALEILELHHHAIRIGDSPEGVGDVTRFYKDVLGLGSDSDRPSLPFDIHWIDVGDRQIHLMAIEGVSPLAVDAAQDPSRPHVALAVADLDEAREELERMGVPYWTPRGDEPAMALFVRDPADNVIELHQIDRCRCVRSRRTSTTRDA